VYCPDEHLSVADIVEATRVYAAFGALALTAGAASAGASAGASGGPAS
jgi:hypothetical protein